MKNLDTPLNRTSVLQTSEIQRLQLTRHWSFMHIGKGSQILDWIWKNVSYYFIMLQILMFDNSSMWYELFTVACFSWFMPRIVSSLEINHSFRVTEMSELRTPPFSKGSVTLGSNVYIYFLMQHIDIKAIYKTIESVLSHLRILLSSSLNSWLDFLV